ncbi:UNVERIFIED_CONTAM: hypothetical protein Sindi_2630000 [Sesamum indicum]
MSTEGLKMLCHDVHSDYISAEHNGWHSSYEPDQSFKAESVSPWCLVAVHASSVNRNSRHNREKHILVTVHADSQSQIKGTENTISTKSSDDA